jgi:ribosomal protein S18 acetylase RimI-like enzyme
MIQSSKSSEATLKRQIKVTNQRGLMDHRQIRFSEGLTPHSPSESTAEDWVQLQRLFQGAAFWAEDRTLEDLKIAISHSKPVISVWDCCPPPENNVETSDRLIGFARATSDGIYRATIWDVVIHPDYRGEGLGGKLLHTLLAHPHLNRVERIYLMTTHQQTFYERMGFTQNSSTTMMLYQPKDSPVLSWAAETPQQAPRT